MKSNSLKITDPIIIVSFIGDALHTAILKLKNLGKKTKPYSVEEIVDMDSPRMKRALKIVSAINDCENGRDIKYMERVIKFFNAEYPEPNPLMSFLENKAFDVMACTHVNAEKQKQARIRQEIQDIKIA